MLIFVGLGNPGSKYAANRHNIGFMALDQIASDYRFVTWRDKFNAQIATGTIKDQKIMLVKPQTYMNKSGLSVQAAMAFYKIKPSAITVFHDELDLPLGKLRVKMGGGHAGHNGLRSIHQMIGADYQRIRMGVGHPGDKAKVANYVLSDFAKSEQQLVEDINHAISDQIPLLVDGASERFQSNIAQALQPPAKPKKEPKANPPAKPAAPDQQDARSPLQKLADKFGRN